MRALSDALPTGHRAMANPTPQLHFGCGGATPPVSHSHNWPSGRMQNFLFKIGQKSYFLPIKTPKIILTIEWYYRRMYCRSNAMIFFLNGQFEGDIIFCHLNEYLPFFTVARYVEPETTILVLIENALRTDMLYCTTYRFTVSCNRNVKRSILIQVMDCWWMVDKPVSKPVIVYMIRPSGPTSTNKDK